jgi:uncharacterized membrane protein
MKKNVGNIDKTVRLIVALAIVVLLLLDVVAITSTLGIIMAVVAVIFAGTALVGTCPLYLPFGLSTKK